MYYIMYAPAESVSNLNCTSHLRLCRCSLLIPTSSPSLTLPSPRHFTWLVHTPPQIFLIPFAKSRKLQVPLTSSYKSTELAVCTCTHMRTHLHSVHCSSFSRILRPSGVFRVCPFLYLYCLFVCACRIGCKLWRQHWLLSSALCSHLWQAAGSQGKLYTIYNPRACRCIVITAVGSH